MGCLGGDVNVPGPTAQEVELQQIQLDTIKKQNAYYAQMEPYILQNMGYKKDSSGNIVAMTDAEKYNAMSEVDKGTYDINKLMLERQKNALEGKLPVSPALENELAKQKTDLEAYLSRKLGSNWANSTPGIQALAEFNKNAETLREEARTGQITSGEQLLLAGLQGQQQAQNYATSSAASFPSFNSGLVGLSSQAQQPYQYYNGLALQANMANAQNSAGLMQGLGSLAGTGLMAKGVSGKSWSSLLFA